MKYILRKNAPKREGKKQKRLLFLTGEDVKKILDAVEQSDSPHKQRDYAAIFLGYHFGLRVSEAAMLDRRTFRDLEEGAVHIKTLKQSKRIAYSCIHCRKRVRLAMSRAGKEWKCLCGHTQVIPDSLAEKAEKLGIPEKEPPAVEAHVIDFLKEYLASLPADQQWLFPGRSKGKHITSRQLENVFATYLSKAGLSAAYSWHALRHGRGVLIWERTGDIKAVQEFLRHTGLGSTEFYIHISPKRGKELAEKLGADTPFKKPTVTLTN